VNVAVTDVAALTPVAPASGCVAFTAGAVVSTVQVRCAGVASTLPAASVARTANAWEPSLRPAYCCPETQAAKGAASRLHWNVAVASSEENLNTADADVTVPDGPASMVVSGAVVSAAGVADTTSDAALALPVVSRATTR
jgi:hypothetical protein